MESFDFGVGGCGSRYYWSVEELKILEACARQYSGEVRYRKLVAQEYNRQARLRGLLPRATYGIYKKLSVLRLQKLPAKGWSRAEEDLLIELLEEHCLSEIPRRYNARARARGWPQRSSLAIRVRAKELEKKCDWVEINSELVCELTRNRIACLLGISPHRVKAWGLPTIREGSRLISKQTLVNFAKTNPARFAGIKEEKLLNLFFDCPEVVRLIKAQEEQGLRPSHSPVINTLGQKFYSLGEAARSIGRTRQCLHKAFKKYGEYRTQDGVRWFLAKG